MMNYLIHSHGDHEPLTKPKYFGMYLLKTSIHLYNHSTVIKFKKFNIGTILESNTESVFRFYPFPQ